MDETNTQPEPTPEKVQKIADVTVTTSKEEKIGGIGGVKRKPLGNRKP